MRKVYIGPFCSRLIVHVRDIDYEPTLRWWSAHVVPLQALNDDAMERNRALQAAYRARHAPEHDAHGRAGQKVRRKKG